METKTEDFSDMEQSEEVEEIEDSKDLIEVHNDSKYPLTNDQKLEILQLCDKGTMKSDISAMYNISRQGIYYILKHRERYENWENQPTEIAKSSIKKEGKRPHRTLSLETKLLVIADIERGGSNYRKIAEKYQIGKSTVAEIFMKRDSIREFVDDYNPGTERRTLRQQIYPFFEEAVLIFIIQERLLGTPITRAFALSVANRFYEMINGETKELGKWWWSNFKKRNQLLNINLSYDMKDDEMQGEFLERIILNASKSSFRVSELYRYKDDENFWEQILKIDLNQLVEEYKNYPKNSVNIVRNFKIESLSEMDEKLINEANKKKIPVKSTKKVPLKVISFDVSKSDLIEIDKEENLEEDPEYCFEIEEDFIVEENNGITKSETEDYSEIIYEDTLEPEYLEDVIQEDEEFSEDCEVPFTIEKLEDPLEIQAAEAEGISADDFVMEPIEDHSKSPETSRKSPKKSRSTRKRKEEMHTEEIPSKKPKIESKPVLNPLSQLLEISPKNKKFMIIKDAAGNVFRITPKK